MHLKIRDAITSGLIENLLSAMIFFSPNFLLLFPFFKERLYIFLLYNYVIIFIILSVMSHFRFGIKNID